jgi:hypothetical protein
VARTQSPLVQGWPPGRPDRRPLTLVKPEPLRQATVVLGRGRLEADALTREAAMPRINPRRTRLLVALSGVVGVIALTAHFFIPPTAPPDRPRSPG